MATIKYNELTRRIKLEGAKSTVNHIRKNLMEGQLKFDDFSLRDLAEATICTKNGDSCGREWVNQLNPAGKGRVQLLEADGAIDSSTFSNLTAQIVYSAIMEQYNQAEYIHTSLCPTRPSKFKKELIPGITGITEDMEDDVMEGAEFPAVGFSEQYTETPLTAKKGRILRVTKEIIFHDQTGLVRKGCDGISDLLGVRREKDYCRRIAGITNSYKWNGTSYNTFQTSAPWINVKSGNGITVDGGQVAIDASEQLFNGMLDPWTGNPITIMPNTIVAMPARKHQFQRVIRATQLVGSGANSAAYNQTISENTVQNYPLVFSRWLFAEIVKSGVSASDAADWWFHGDFSKFVEWIENWPMTVVQAPPNSQAEFAQDIVLQFKCSQKGTHNVKDPRAAVKNYKA